MHLDRRALWHGGEARFDGGWKDRHEVIVSRFMIDKMPLSASSE
jgi:hypothetical protein